ncbi:21badb70-83ea-4f5e-99ab-2929c25861e6 [Thermothielavioides terrestris]|uniref:21badb70-83ea-4f5e-99ab-2929c25861e6 n=1 Tax=Thermothielavioides terrestris TaxID=2587410 RepID=A0A3S4BK09_9PEZI|nr:21badb70-83ea-4f5e-99ab-2929c25861e6 [Thermothielavioides terrestris]
MARRRCRCASSSLTFHSSAASRSPRSARRWSGRSRLSVGGSRPFSTAVISFRLAANVVSPYVLPAFSTRLPARQISSPPGAARSAPVHVPLSDRPAGAPSAPNTSTCTSSPRPPKTPLERNSTAALAPVPSLTTCMVPTGSTYFSPMTTLRRKTVANSSEPSGRRRQTRTRPSVVSSALLPQNFCVGAGACANDHSALSACMASRTGRCDTFSTSSRKPPGTSASERTSSNVSPSSGLNGLRTARSLARPLLNCETAKAATRRSRCSGWLCFAAASSSCAYSSCSAMRCSSEIGSLADTGIEMVLRSLPTFLRTNAIRLGGATLAGGMVLRRAMTSEMGSGVSDFGFGGNRLPTPSPVCGTSSSSTDEMDDDSWIETSSASEAGVSSSLWWSISMSWFCDRSESPASASKNSSTVDAVDSMLFLGTAGVCVDIRLRLLLLRRAENSTTTESRSFNRAAQLS